MEGKRNVLWYADSCTSPTGFGNVSASLLKRIYATGQYEFDLVAINFDGSPYNHTTYPYNIYPAISPLSTNTQMRNDVYGRNKFLMMAGSGKYDLVFILNDLFVVQTVFPQLLEIQKKLPKERKFEIILYFPIDSVPKKEWVTEVASKCNFPVTYTNYAKNEVLKHDPLLTNLNVIYHGVDKNIFFPFPKEEIPKLKMRMFGPDHSNKFVALAVARNQPRKDLHKLFASFKLFHDKYPNTFLFLLAQAQDVGGDLMQIANAYGLTWDKEWACPAPGSYGAGQGYPIEVVNKIYNASDVVVSSSLGEGWNLCLKPHTRVYTETGVKPIGSLTVMDKVLSSNGAYNKVERIASRDYKGKIYKIMTWLTNTPVEASNNHPFYVLENGNYIWKNAEDLKVNDCLLFPKKYSYEENPIMDTFEILKPHLNSRQLKNVLFKDDSWAITSNFTDNIQFIPRYIKITPEFCRLIGLYLAEGCNSSDGIRFCMNKNETEEFSFIAAMMDKYFNLKEHIDDVSCRGENYQGKTTSYFSSIVAKLMFVLFDKGSRNIKIPSMFLNLSPECLKELVYGMYLGDGSYSKTNFEVSICTTSTNLAYSLKIILARLGVSSAVRHSRVEYKVGISGLSKEKLLKMFGLPFPPMDRKGARERTFSNEDFLIFPIKSIEIEEDDCELIDIQVANTQDFVAENVIVHNCTSEAMATMKPLIVPRNTSMIEIIGENEERGWHVKSGATLNDWVCLGPGDNSNIRPTIDVYDMANKLEYIYTHPEEVRTKVERAYSEVWTWNDVCKEWIALFDKAWNKVQVMRSDLKQERNAPCACGSGKKAKNCCM